MSRYKVNKSKCVMINILPKPIYLVNHSKYMYHA